MPDASDKCLSILALQGVPAVWVIEGSVEMLMLYWGNREQAVVFPEQD